MPRRALALLALAASACTSLGDAEITSSLPEAGETWTDPTTGARWTLASSELDTWRAGNAQCLDLERGDGSHWRPPTIDEASAVARAQVTAIGAGLAWTTEPADVDILPDGAVTHTAWAVRMQDGETQEVSIDGSGIVLCVDRGSESGEEVCMTGMDEDGDTLTDCEDGSCWRSEECGADCTPSGDGSGYRGCACVSDEGCDDMTDQYDDPLGLRCLEGYGDGLQCQ